MEKKIYSASTNNVFNAVRKFKCWKCFIIIAYGARNIKEGSCKNKLIREKV